MVIEFEGTDDPAGLEVYDPIEKRRLHVRTTGPIAPEPADPARFCFPVDTTCTIETNELVFDQYYHLNVHDGAGRSSRSLEPGERARLESSLQFVGLSGPMKLYCRIADPGRVETGINSVRIAFDGPTRVAIGARSLHERPAATIRTPDDVEAMMGAVTALSSALKTTSAERSWPTLRGHPPLIELDRSADLDVPDVVASPDTDVTIRVPPDYRSLYTVSPLAFYLGAAVEPGEVPHLEAGSTRYEFDGGCGGGEDRRTAFETDVARALKRTFLLDCVVRTEGLYSFALHERNELEAALPFDPGTIYDASLAERVARYLEVPYDRLEPYVPRWPLTAHVPATPEGAEVLPFVVDELGVVREPRGTTIQRERGTPDGSRPQLVRSAGTHRSPTFEPPGDDEMELVRPAVREESIEHAWFGAQVPSDASKATLEAYRSQLSRRAKSGSIDIVVVCNDARMIDEHDLIDETYGNRETLPFTIRSEFGASTDDLATVLTEGGYDFLHYIGHATPDGLECSDGQLDVRSLSSVDLGVFFLNACRSYEQGLALARRGAFGGIATLGDVINEQAVAVGEVTARLLNLGFPLRAALELARELSILGEQYLVVGDGSADIAQSDGGPPSVVELDRRGCDEFEFRLRSYPTKDFKLGTAAAANLQSTADKHLCPRTTPPTSVSEEAISDFLTWTEGPVLLDGHIHWNDSIGPFPIE